MGLEGQYAFELHFQLREANSRAGEYLIRARSDMGLRSVSAEIELEKGEYEVLPKILASRYSDKPAVEDVVKRYADQNPQKLRQLGVNHDIANAKGLGPEDMLQL